MHTSETPVDGLWSLSVGADPDAAVLAPSQLQLRAQRADDAAVAAVVELLGGRELFGGKVADVNRATTTGFAAPSSHTHGGNKIALTIGGATIEITDTRMTPRPHGPLDRHAECSATGSVLPAAQAVPEKAALRAGVRVVVVGDIAHVVVYVVLVVEVFRDDEGQTLVHVGELSLGRRDPVAPPDHHRNGADLTLRDPADVVLVEPLGDPSRLAEIAILRRARE